MVVAGRPHAQGLSSPPSHQAGRPTSVAWSPCGQLDSLPHLIVHPNQSATPPPRFVRLYFVRLQPHPRWLFTPLPLKFTPIVQQPRCRPNTRTAVVGFTPNLVGQPPHPGPLWLPGWSPSPQYVGLVPQLTKAGSPIRTSTHLYCVDTSDVEKQQGSLGELKMFLVHCC